MPISSETRTAGPFVGNGVTTAFPFEFKVFAAADMLVVKLEVATGTETTLALTSDYTVSLNADQNADPGGTVTLNSALPTGFKLVVSSALEFLQETDLTNQGGFYPSVVTNALDRLTILCQQLKEDVERSAKLPITSAVDADTLVTNINAVADSLTDIATVAGIEGDVTDVAAIAADVTTAAANVADITNFADVWVGPSATDPTTRTDSSALQAGDLYFNTADSEVRVYDGDSWEAVAQGVSTPYQSFSGTGAQTAFTLSSAPGTLGSLEVFISGVRQVPTTDYTVSGTTLTFTSAPALGTSNIFCRWISTQAITVPADGSVGTTQLQDGSVTTAKLASGAVTSAKLASGAAVANIGTGGISATELASNAVTTAKITDANITAAKLSGAQSGSAPIYGARAWVNLNGTGTVAVRASGNVTSITDLGTGQYTVNFTTALPDANYSVACSGSWDGSAANRPSVAGVSDTGANWTTSSVQVNVTNPATNANLDVPYINVTIFR